MHSIQCCVNGALERPAQAEARLLAIGEHGQTREPDRTRIQAVTKPLTPGERAAWRAVLLVADLLRFEVAAEVGPMTGLSPADHSVLMHLDEAPGRQIGQQNMANAMFWSKSRLSQQLTRMQERGLVERPVAKGFRLVRR